MKTFFTTLALAGLLSASGVAQQTQTNGAAQLPVAGASASEPIRLRSVEAKDHIGANAIITGKVADVHKSASVVRLNFDEPFPKQSFTAIVFSRNTNRFSNLEQLKGKTVEVTGKIALYRDHPEVELQSTNQLKVLTAPSDTDKK